MAELSPAVVERLREALGARQVLPGERLARYTTWKVGGPADVLCVVGSVGRMCAAVRLAWEAGLPWRVLGRGSNVLVADAGVEGLVILNRCARITIAGTRVECESGTMLSALGKRTIAAGLGGLEWAAGIPGTVGGAVVNNAGAHGGDMAGVLREVTTLRREGGCQTYGPAELDLGYRSSVFRAGGSGREEVILGAAFALVPEEVATLEGRFAGQRAARRAAQPQGVASAGSVFTNPPGESAGRLVESLGLKGLSVGGARISGVHANFLVNGGEATAEEIARLIVLVRERVRAAYGIDLQPEVQQIGRWGGSPRWAAGEAGMGDG